MGKGRRPTGPAGRARRIDRGALGAVLGSTLAVLVLPSPVEGAFSFRKTLTINGTRVQGGPHLDFPVLVSVVDADLANPPTGGVQSPGGYDIQFRAADGITILDHEIEHYDGATGSLVAWVRFPGTAGPPDTRIQNGLSTSFFVYYGDSSVTCARNNPRLVWDPDYRFVLHLSEPTGNPIDSSQAGSPTRLNPNGDALAAVTQNVAGRIAGALDLTTPPDRTDVGDVADHFGFPTGCFPGCLGTGTDTQLLVDDGTMPLDQDYTLETWVRFDTLTNDWYGIVAKGRDDLPLSANDWMGLYKRAPPSRFALGNKNGGNVNGATSPAAGPWYHVVVTSDVTGRRVYVDGLLEQTAAAAGHTAVDFQTRIGDDSNGFYVDGQVDEVRFSNVARSTDWIATTFRSHECPSTSSCPSGVPANRFVDVAAQAGAPFMRLVDSSSASGLAIGLEKTAGITWSDFNGDSCLDVLVNQGGDGVFAGSRLLVQGKSDNCTGRWTDVTTCLASGLGAIPDEWRSTVWGDFDNDGNPDFARNYSGRIEVYRNGGPGTTVDPSCPGGSFPWSRFGAAGSPTYVVTGLNTEGPTWIDWNRDGYLDLYFDTSNAGMLIYQNSGPPGFTFAAVGGTGLPASGSFAPVDFAAVGDVDVDGDVDILARNGDTGLPQDLWLYDAGTSQFQAAAGFPNVVPNNSNKGGVALCDFDDDGDFDIVWTDSPTTDIYEQTGVGTGSFVVRVPGLFATDDVDGVACGDLDNDGDVDLVATASVPAMSGSNRDDRVLRNNGGFSFSDVTPPGFGSADGEGVVLGDYDRDGDLDVLVNQWSTGGTATNELWRNETSNDNYLMVRALWDVDGVPGGVTRDAVGATVTLRDCSGALVTGVREVNGAEGHGTQSPALVHFGLPTTGLPRGPALVYEVNVRYLDGTLRRRAVVPGLQGCYQEVSIRSTDADDTSLCAATAVELQSFAARAGDRCVDLEWQTASELDNLGFHVHRSLSDTGPWTRISPDLIPGLGSSPAGTAYSFRDGGLQNGTAYFYKLEDIDTASVSSFHGPVSAVPSTSAGDPAAEDGGRPAPREDDGEPAADPYGNPEDVSLRILARTARSLVLELRTPGFYASSTPSGYRLSIPGFDLPRDPSSPALPFKRAVLSAPVGRRARIAWIREAKTHAYPGLVPAAVGDGEMVVGWDGTVHPGRRERRLQTGNDVVPPALVSIEGEAFIGKEKALSLVLHPLRFDPATGEVRLTGRLRVKVLFDRVSTRREKGSGSRGRAEPGRLRRSTRRAVAFLHTRQPGLYAVSFEEIFPARRRGVHVDSLRLTRQGQVVPFQVQPGRAGKRFRPGSRLFFYSDTEASSVDFASEITYALEWGTGGVRMRSVSAAPHGPPPASPPVSRHTFEVNRFYQPGLLEAPDIWLWDFLLDAMEKSFPFAVQGLDTTRSRGAEMRLVFQGASDDPASEREHHLSLSVNGVPLGETTFGGRSPHAFAAEVPRSVLLETGNTLSLVNVGDTAADSYVFLDRFEVLAPRSLRLLDGRFDGVFPQGGAATVVGRARYAVDVTDPRAPRWLTHIRKTRDRTRLRVEAGHRYLLASREGLLAPRVERPRRSRLRDEDNAAQWILVAPEAFLEAAAPLVERRRDQGLDAIAVSFEEVVSEFGHGQPSAQAIRAFLAHAFHRWSPPSLRYVVLLGDSSYDPRNFTGMDRGSPLPALWVKTSYLWTVSDPTLGAVNGEDALPDVAVGRLPATTVEEAEALVQKVLAWEDGARDLEGPAVLVADNPDSAGDFERDIADIRASFLQDRNSRSILLREHGPQTRPEILSALDAGASLVTYAGHGGPAVWASENVLNSWDADRLLDQAEQPLMTTFNCLNGYFVVPNYDSLAEAFLKARGRGTIGAVSPSGLSLDGPAHRFHRAFMAELTSGRHQRLGGALLAAQATFAEEGVMPELVSIYHLLGDPGLKIAGVPRSRP